MERLRRLRGFRCLVLAFYALAMAFLGFAHQPISSSFPLFEKPAKEAVDLAAYALPDGTLPTICDPASDHPDSGSPQHVKASLCDACVLVGAPGLPVADAQSVPSRRPANSSRVDAVAELLFDRVRSYVPHLRGPPQRS